jgi:hypothetical protein
MMPFRNALFVLLWMMLFQTGSVFATGMLTTVFTGQPPTIDGSLNDPCWKQVKEADGYTELEGGKPARLQTYVQSRFDDKYLYFAFRCEEPQKALKLNAQQRDDAVWFDSCVEIFIAPDRPAPILEPLGEGERYFHLIFNPLGTQFDQIGTGSGASWNGKWSVKCRISGTQWTAEVAIPFSDVFVEDYNRPPSMSVWRIQLGRSAYGQGGTFHEYSSLFGAQGMFRNPGDFGNLVFVTDTNMPNLRWQLDDLQIVQPAFAQLKKTLSDIGQPDDTNGRAEITHLSNDLEKFSNQFKEARRPGYERVRPKLLGAIEQLRIRARSLQAEAVMREAHRHGDKVAAAPHPAINDLLRVTPDFLPAPNVVGKPVSIVLTANEYEASSIVIWSDKALNNVMVRVEGLTNSAGDRLPESSVDCRWVKCWYQGSDSEILFTGKILTPELLLHNPDMVKVDLDTKQNILLSRGVPENDRTFWRRYPDDASRLQPITHLPPSFATQVWLTAHVPAQTKAGQYHGKIVVSAGGNTIATLDIGVTVLDFELRPSMMQHAFYTNSWWGSREVQSKARAMAEMHNLVAHGITDVLLRETLDNIGAVVPMMKEAGLDTNHLYIGGDGGDWSLSETTSTEYAYSQAKKWVEATGRAGVKQVYLYMIDEARDKRLADERPLVEAIHRAGAKTFVACYADYFPIAGDMIDAPIIAHGPVESSLVKKIHDRGAHVYSYANPQGGVERPEEYRRNFGLLLWQAHYDGAFDWVYWWNMGPDGWNDFDSDHYRDCNMVYPTMSGVVDTIQWEGWREGVDDCRYMATLSYWIEQAKEAGHQKEAESAAAWRDAIRNGGVAQLTDLGKLRQQIIHHIQLCKAAVGK